jgi:hypothetical protein
MSMKPERSNYEIWLIDYFDGTLDNNQVEELMDFLDKNPDLKEHLSENFAHSLKPANETFRFKDSLKKDSSDLAGEQFELLCISASEHDLGEAEVTDLEKMIEVSPEKREIFDFYKKAVLKAPAVHFRNKQGLRRLSVTQKIIRISVIGLSAAAGIALFISLSVTPGRKEVISVPLTTAVNRSEPGEEKISSPSLSRDPQPVRQSPAKNEFKTSTLSAALNAPQTSLTREAPIPIPVSNPEPERIAVARLEFKQEVSLAGEIPSDLSALNQVELQSSVVSDRYGSDGLFARLFRERITKSGTNESGSIKGYEIADAGIIGLNKLFGWQMSLKPTRNKKGEVTSLYFSSKILKFNAPVKRSQEEVSGS